MNRQAVFSLKASFFSGVNGKKNAWEVFDCAYLTALCISDENHNIQHGNMLTKQPQGPPSWGGVLHARFFKLQYREPGSLENLIENGRSWSLWAHYLIFMS